MKVLAWIGAGLAAVVLILWVTRGRSERPAEADREAPPQPLGPASQPGSASGPYSEATKARLADDSLPPPPPTAPSDERREYERALREIERGRDPLFPVALDTPQGRQDLVDRLRARSEAARRRLKQVSESNAARSNTLREARREKLIRAGLNPDDTSSSAGPHPELGPAVLEVDPATGEAHPAPEPARQK